MRFVKALDSPFSYADDLPSLDKFKTLLDTDTLEHVFEFSSIATVRRRKLPLDAVMWVK